MTTATLTRTTPKTTANRTASNRTASNRTASSGTSFRLRPAFPPPGPTRRAPAPQPASFTIGQRVELSCTDGIYRGRVLSCSDEAVRLQDGAGIWHVELGAILSVASLPAPTHTPVDEHQIRHENANRAARILQRWP
jgi:hypothetical protein